MEHEGLSAVPLAEPPEGPKIPQEYPDLLMACSDGDVVAAERLMTGYCTRTPSEELDLDVFSGLLSLNLSGNSPSVPLVSYLVSKGVPIKPSAFVQATKLKSYDLLRLFLDHGFDINQPDGTDPPALAAAVEDEDLTRWLLSRGADPNAESEFWDRTPLSVAMLRASVAVINLLFEHGGSTEHGQLLHEAVWRSSADVVDVVTLILDHGATINDVMYQKRPEIYRIQFVAALGTPLHVAAERGNLELVDLLLKRGGDPLVRDSYSRTPLERAEQHADKPGVPSVIERLKPISIPPAEPRRYFTDDMNLPRVKAEGERWMREQGIERTDLDLTSVVTTVYE